MFLSYFLSSFEVLSSEEVRERIRLICAGEPGEKAGFPKLLAIASAEERTTRLKVKKIFYHAHIFIFSDRFLIMLCFYSWSGCELHTLVRINIPPLFQPTLAQMH